MLWCHPFVLESVGWKTSQWRPAWLFSTRTKDTRNSGAFWKLQENPVSGCWCLQPQSTNPFFRPLPLIPFIPFQARHQSTQPLCLKDMASVHGESCPRGLQPTWTHLTLTHFLILPTKLSTLPPTISPCIFLAKDSPFAPRSLFERKKTLNKRRNLHRLHHPRISDRLSSFLRVGSSEPAPTREEAPAAARDPFENGLRCFLR